MLKRVEGSVTYKIRKHDETSHWASHFWIDQWEQLFNFFVVVWIRKKFDKANNVLKYGKYFKCLFNSFLSQLFSNSVLFCSLFLNSDYSFSNYSGNFLFADQRGILSNHRRYCASLCIPSLGPHKINFLSVVIYSFHLWERAPLEFEGFFCRKNSPSNYTIRQLETGSCSNAQRSHWNNNF